MIITAKAIVKKAIIAADAALRCVLPAALLKKIFPEGGLYKTIAMFRLKRKSPDIQRSVLHNLSDIEPSFRVAYFNGCPDGGRSDRYRVYEPVRYLSGRNVLADVYSYSGISELLTDSKYDLLVIFRCQDSSFLQLSSVLELYRKARIPICFDADDDLLSRCSKYARDATLATLAKCDMMTVSTEHLKALYSKVFSKPIYVVPIAISEQQYEVSQRLLLRRAENREKRNKIRIAYLCGTNTHDLDFLEAADALANIMRRYPDTELVLVGPVKVPAVLNEVQNQVLQLPYMPYLDLLKLTADIDINIAPLTSERFNQAKSEVKVTEAALLEVPTIASPIPAYASLITSGRNGMLANSAAEWETALELLIKNEGLRLEMGKQAAKDFVERFRIEKIGARLFALEQSWVKEKQR